MPRVFSNADSSEPRETERRRMIPLSLGVSDMIYRAYEESIQDTVETADQLSTDATEFSAERAQSLLILQELLAEQTFRTDESFTRVLSQELKRVRRSGAVVIISPRLDPALTDLALSFRRMGPNVRYYLVTYEAEQPGWLPFIRRMQEAGAEVCYVTPAS